MEGRRRGRPWNIVSAHFLNGRGEQPLSTLSLLALRHELLGNSGAGRSSLHRPKWGVPAVSHRRCEESTGSVFVVLDTFSQRGG